MHCCGCVRRNRLPDGIAGKAQSAGAADRAQWSHPPPALRRHLERSRSVRLRRRFVDRLARGRLGAPPHFAHAVTSSIRSFRPMASGSPSPASTTATRTSTSSPPKAASPSASHSILRTTSSSAGRPTAKTSSSAPTVSARRSAAPQNSIWSLRKAAARTRCPFPEVTSLRFLLTAPKSPTSKLRRNSAPGSATAAAGAFPSPSTT